MRSVSSVLARCWARHAISRGDARIKREQRGSGLNPSRCPEQERKRSRGRERERRAKREIEKKKTGRRSKPTHLECKSAGKKNKLGGSNNKEICFSSNTHTHIHTCTRHSRHAYTRAHMVRAPLLFLLDVSPPSRSFFKRTYTRTLRSRTHIQRDGRTFESYLALTARFKGPPCYLTS